MTEPHSVKIWCERCGCSDDVAEWTRVTRPEGAGIVSSTRQHLAVTVWRHRICNFMAITVKRGTIAETA